MKLPLIAALFLLGCGGTSIEQTVVYVTSDAGHLGALASDTGAPAVQVDPPAVDAGADSVGDGGSDAGMLDADPPDASDPADAASDADTACSRDSLPDAWAPSNLGTICGAVQASEFLSACPPCAAFAFNCNRAQTFPVELADAGWIPMPDATSPGAVCSPVAACVSLGQRQGFEYCDGGSAISCSPGLAPSAGCTPNGIGANTFCCGG